MNDRWRIRKVSNLFTPTRWMVHAPDGSWAGAFATWGEAMEATCVAYQVEQWLGKVAQRPVDGTEWTE